MIVIFLDFIHIRLLLLLLLLEQTDCSQQISVLCFHLLVVCLIQISVEVPAVDVDVVLARSFLFLLFGVLLEVVVALIQRSVLRFFVFIVVSVVDLVYLLIGELRLRERLLVIIDGVFLRLWPKGELAIIPFLYKCLPVNPVEERMTHNL